MSGISYNIISYDAQNLGLIKLTEKVLVEFVNPVGVQASIQCLECRDCDELVSQWETLGSYQEDDDGAFSCRLLKLCSKAGSRLSPAKTVKTIFVTDQSIGRWMGVTFGATAIISAYEITQNDPEIFVTNVFHELGHMHETPSRERRKVDAQIKNDDQIIALEKEVSGTDAIYECFGEHCLNFGCSMRQRLCLKDRTLTEERLQIGRPYCDRCLTDLKVFCLKTWLFCTNMER